MSTPRRPHYGDLRTAPASTKGTRPSKGGGKKGPTAITMPVKTVEELLEESRQPNSPPQTSASFTITRSRALRAETDPQKLPDFLERLEGLSLQGHSSADREAGLSLLKGIARKTPPKELAQKFHSWLAESASGKTAYEMDYYARALQVLFEYNPESFKLLKGMEGPGGKGGSTLMQFLKKNIRSVAVGELIVSMSKKGILSDAEKTQLYADAQQATTRSRGTTASRAPGTGR